MAFTVQDDTGTVAGANAYLSVADFRTYWTNKNIDTSSLIDAAVQGLIVEATQYIDQRYEYCGCPLDGRDQTTEFPREYLYDKYGNLVEGIPREVKDATAEYAYKGYTTALSQTFTSTDQNVKSESKKVDVIEKSVDYSGNKVSVSTWNIYQIADKILQNSGFVFQTIGMMRG